ncbi:MAG: hypothetical protein ACYCOU_15705 [Sulfobacillus sp.]
MILDPPSEFPSLSLSIFDGIEDISRASELDRNNGQFIKAAFEPMFGDLLNYWGSAAQPNYDYGAIFPNTSFTEFTVTKC